MTSTFIRLAAIATAAIALSSASRADSGASSASSAGSASVGSLSNSITASSNSSSPAGKVAEGDYRVVEVAALAERPGMWRLQLQFVPLAQALPAGRDSGPIWLTLPEQALATRPLRAGDIVHARHQAYGIEFARAVPDAQGTQRREAFFLVLADDWFGELAPRVLSL